MACTREQAVELLNVAKLAEGATKVDHLRGLLELVVRKEPTLLPEFLPEVLELQVDPSPAVRRFLADFVDAALAASPTPVVLQHGLACLRGLLSDEGAATAKRSLQSCYTAFRAAYTLVAVQGGSCDRCTAEALQALWSEAQELEVAVAAAAAKASSDAVRVAAAKFLEQAVLLLTADLVPAVAGISAAAVPLAPSNLVTSKAALVRDAEAALAQIVSLVKQGATAAQKDVPGTSSGLLTTTAIKAAAGIAQQRPQFMGRLLPALLALANSGILLDEAAGTTHAQNSGDAASAARSSVAGVMKDSLLALARSTHPSAQPWKKKLGAALDALGVEGASDAGTVGSRSSNKRAQPSCAESSKRPKLDSHGWQSPRLQPPVPPAQRPPPSAALGSAPYTVPLAETPPDQLAKVLTLLQALVASQDAVMLAGVVGNLQPAVLADVVMTYMSQLPPRQDLMPDAAAWPPWLDTLVQLVAAQANSTSLPTAAPADTETADAEQEQQGSPMPSAQQPQQLQLPPQQQTFNSLPSVALAEDTDHLEPILLAEQQLSQLRLDAVLRILRTDKTSRLQLRSVLVAKLAAEARGSMAPALMDHLVQGIADTDVASADEVAGAGSQLEVALLWLSMLFAQDCVPIKADVTADPSGIGCKAQLQTEPGRMYERMLMQLLRGLRHALHPSSRVIVCVLLEAPALPMPAVRQFLEEIVSAGPDWCTLALLAARDVISHRPPSRPALLELVLDACCSPNPDTRGKAVRLVANRFFPDPLMAPDIERAARQKLDAMAQPGGAAPMPTPAASQLPAAAYAEPHQRPPGSPTDAALPSAAQQEPSDKDMDSISQLGPPDGQCGGAIDVAQAAPPASPSPAEPGVDGACVEGPTMDDAAQLCALYCALCTQKHSLLRHLFEVFGQTSEGGRAAIQRNAGGLAKTLGASASALLAVTQDPPEGSLPLVLQMLHVLTEAAVPQQLLVTACLQLYDRCKDARVLVPVLRGVDRATALRLLPALLDLKPEQLRSALQRLVVPLTSAAMTGAGAGEAAADAVLAPAVVSPHELLSALHTLDHSRDGGLLRKMMQGVTVCISSPALFPAEALAACISQLLTRVPLPQLFMRTVIQTAAAAPRLRSFVVGVLRQLATKQIWQDATQWKGWLMCAQQTVPDSFPALLSLPADIIADAAAGLPAAAKQQLVEHARQGDIVVPSATLSALEQLTNQT